MNSPKWNFLYELVFHFRTMNFNFMHYHKTSVHIRHSKMFFQVKVAQFLPNFKLSRKFAKQRRKKYGNPRESKSLGQRRPLRQKFQTTSTPDYAKTKLFMGKVTCIENYNDINLHNFCKYVTCNNINTVLFPYTGYVRFRILHHLSISQLGFKASSF